MTKLYIKKSEKIYQELYKSLVQLYDNQTVSLEFIGGVGNAIGKTTNYINFKINNNNTTHEVDNNSFEHTKPEDYNFYYQEIYDAVDSFESTLFEKNRYCDSALKSDYYAGNIFVIANIKHYINSCFVEE